MEEKKEKRERSPILKTIQRAVKMLFHAGQAKQLVFMSSWVLLGMVTSFTAIFNEKFLNAASDLILGKDDALSRAVFWLLIWGGIEITFSFFEMISDRVSSKMWCEFSYFIEKELIHKCLRIRVSYFDDRDANKKIHFVKNGFSGRITSVVSASLYVLHDVLQFVTALLIILNVNWKIALIVLVTTIPAVWVSKLQTDQLYKLNQWNSLEGQMQRYLALVLTKRKYAKEMRFYRLYDYMEDKYDKSVNIVYKQQMEITKKFFALGIVTSILQYGAIAAALFLITKDIFAGVAQIGAFMLIYNSVNNMRNSMTNIFSKFDVISDQGRYLEDYETVMGYEEEFSEDEDVKGNSHDDGLEIRFEHVSFTYPGSDREIIKDLNLTIHQGEKIAIIGENGSGKSTFVSLLTGLYMPTKGRILVNGADISERISYLRSKFSCTVQDFLEYNGSVADNVRIGDLDNEHSDKDIEEVLKKADIYDYVQTLENKENTNLGNLYPGSVDLSGGQWQKLAMARNLVKDNAKMMIMDEPTAALDPIAESKLYQEFSDLTQDKTVILISHRLGATRLADRVLVFDDGQIIEDGSHNELLKLGKMYKKMYNAQAQWYI